MTPSKTAQEALGGDPPLTSGGSSSPSPETSTQELLGASDDFGEEFDPWAKSIAEGAERMVWDELKKREEWE